MKWVSVAIGLLGLGAGGLAAWYWYCASKVSTTPIWARGENPFEPVDRELAHMGEIAGLVEGANESARLNKIAAQWTGASIFLSVLSVAIGSFVY
ncbi:MULTISPECIES: hypothetical protein [unclassified Bradyrhizobium]|uniref:hypothetical protein n=1 Tax=unclassified Bradyrhizobium TaxID=2631580 RepID=UPI002915E791|nr:MULTISPECIES: hypothetical protein [unclassified Bradyrhizobium]